jgi:phosphomannomutase
MMEAAENKEIDFVGGTRGGFIFPDFQRGADAAYAAARLLEMLALTRDKVSAKVSQYTPGHFESIEIPCPWNRKGRVMRRLIAHTEKMTRDTVDGVRVNLKDRWVMVAPHRLQASFYLLAEAPSPESATELVEEYRRLVIQWRDIPDGVSQTISSDPAR